MVADFEMEMILPEGIPTLRAQNSGNLTRPDNVFASRLIAQNLISCDTRAERPSTADHYPVITEIRLPHEIKQVTEAKNFKGMDWEKFRQALKERTKNIPKEENIENQAEFDRRYEALMAALVETIEELVTVTKISKFNKRWWTRELTELKKEMNRLESRLRRRRGLPGDPVHTELRQARN